MHAIQFFWIIINTAKVDSIQYSVTMEGDTVQLRKLQNHIKNEKKGETAIEITGN